MDNGERAREIDAVKHGLKKQKKVSQALEDITKKKSPSLSNAFNSADKLWLFVSFTSVVLLALSRNFLLSSSAIMEYVEDHGIPFNRIFNSLISIFIVLALNRLFNALVIRKISDQPMRHNLERLFNLVFILLLSFIIVSTIFINWYTAAISLGILSLIIGVALQNPLVSFFAWIYILIRKPYEVGDRIAMGDVTGDVIDLGYFDTTLWEFGGKYISGDHPSGRIIKFTNSKVFSEYVYNYSWPLFPYLWNEIKFYISYDSDFAFVEKTISEIVEAELGEEMLNRIESYHALLEETPIEALKVRERPAIFFRTSENTWVEVVVRYLVEPKESGRVKSKLIKIILGKLALSKDKVEFPSGNMR